ncbi:MAG: Rpn family recombination-promoting nuclease/putative transposase [Alphaproteobacteria bacterium]|nr:Rpn family recombination-promoting nuclease/putative transposase [Alphaproteobacteria bacterium]
MAIRIDPRVDYAFKKLLGAPENVDLLLDFLNSVLAPDEPFTAVELLNPFNEREYDADKLSVVDLKAVDAKGGRFQVEIQLQVHPALDARMVYTLARVHVEQLGDGQPYEVLQPTIAIWLLDDVLLRDSPAHHHAFTLHDPARDVTLNEHLGLHLIELPKWRGELEALTPEARWIYFFRNAGGWDELPPSLGDPTMRKAMGVLKSISERERDLARYRGRMDQLSVQRTWEGAIERLEAEVKAKDEALQAKDEALQAKDEALQEALAELERLRAERG